MQAPLSKLKQQCNAYPIEWLIDEWVLNLCPGINERIVPKKARKTLKQIIIKLNKGKEFSLRENGIYFSNTNP